MHASRITNGPQQLIEAVFGDESTMRPSGWIEGATAGLPPAAEASFRLVENSIQRLIISPRRNPPLLGIATARASGRSYGPLRGAADTNRCRKRPSSVSRLQPGCTDE